MKQTISITVAFTFFVLLFANPSWAAYPKANQGTYIYSGGAGQQKALEKAIKKISDKVSWFVRGRVHNGLKKVFGIKKKITFKVNKGKIVVYAVGGKSIASSLDNKPTTFRGKKGVVFITRSFSNNTLTEKVQPKGKKGYRHHRYSFSKDGKTMTLYVASYLAKLKKNLKFTVTYKKK